MLKLNASKCIRLLHKNINCNECEKICPTDAISVGNNPLPSIKHDACVECAACDAVCPSEAFELDSFNPEKFLYDFVEMKETLISCKKNVPCISALSVEYIISLAILNKEIIFDMGHCDGCIIAHKCKPQILKNYEEASYILDATLSECSIKLQNIAYQNSSDASNTKRELFRSIIKTPFEKEVDKQDNFISTYISQRVDNALLKQKNVMQKTKILLTALKSMKKPEVFHIVDATEISFTSSKLLDTNKCDACRMCYVVCPTGALTSDIKNSKIDFDASICVKCNACIEVCKVNALENSPSFDIKDLFLMEAKNLINFDVKNCKECGMIFSTNDDDEYCARCRKFL